MPNSSNSSIELVVAPAQVSFFILGVTGILGNFFVVFSQRRDKNLRNFYVRMLAISDAVVGGCFTFHGLNMSITTETYSQSQCFKMNIVPLASMCSSTLLTLFVGIDRLMSIVFPVGYRDIRKGWNCIGSILALVAYPLVSVTIAATEDVEPTYRPAVCVLPTSLGPMAFSIWNVSSMAINVLVVLVYITLGIWLRKRPVADTTDQGRHKKHMATSLLIIAAIHISTWSATLVIMMVVTKLYRRGVSSRIYFHALAYVGIPTAINHGCNGYIYVWRSSVYRNALWDMLRCGRNTGEVRRMSAIAAQCRSGLKPERETML